MPEARELGRVETTPADTTALGRVGFAGGFDEQTR
jgi:hypothetical protein